jgi:hypothetical protein
LFGLINFCFNSTPNNSSIRPPRGHFTSLVIVTATYISQHTGGHNKITFEDMTMGDTTAINLEQVVDIKVTNQAVIQILTNTQIKTDYSSKLSTQLQNSTTSNSTFNTAS